MRALEINANLTDRVYRAILDDILDGHLKAGEHLVQEQLAAGLGVSRQPVQQAMTLLKADGVVEEAGRRGLRVAALDHERIDHSYQLRGLLDGFAARQAAAVVRDGYADKEGLARAAESILAAGARALESQSRAEMIRHDEAFHKAVYDYSGNPLVAPAAEPVWRVVRRAMADVLDRGKPASVILAEHRAILNAILDGQPDLAGQLAEAHTTSAADRLEAVRADRGGAVP